MKTVRLICTYFMEKLCCETFKAISQLCDSAKPFVHIEGNLRTEVYTGISSMIGRIVSLGAPSFM